MKKIFFTLCTALLTLNAAAQKMPTENLNETMARFYEGCLYLRAGIEKNSLTRLDKAATLLDESKNNPDRIVLQNIDLKYNNMAADTISMQGHTYFCGDYARYMYGQRDVVYVDHSHALRSFGNTVAQVSECYVGQDAVTARGEVAYDMVMGGTCKIFVVAEPGGTLSLSVKDEGNGKTYEGTSYEDGGVAYVEWEQSGESTSAVMTIVNTSDKDISFVIASN